MSRNKEEGLLLGVDELDDLEIGDEVTLFFSSTETYRGVYKGLDEGEQIMLKSTKGGCSIGLPLNQLQYIIKTM